MPQPSSLSMDTLTVFIIKSNSCSKTIGTLLYHPLFHLKSSSKCMQTRMQTPTTSRTITKNSSSSRRQLPEQDKLSIMLILMMSMETHKLPLEGQRTLIQILTLRWLECTRQVLSMFRMQLEKADKTDMHET